jgi:tetratricopeptide (TPR) repeat protein
MRWNKTLLFLISAATAAAQEFPEPTEAGMEAVRTLVGRCIVAGGFKPIRDPQTGAPVLTLSDRDKLTAAVAAERESLTPALRDALVGQWGHVPKGEQAAFLALLRAVGEATRDDRALAFAAYFLATSPGDGTLAARAAAFREAADRFRAAGDGNWQASCLNLLGQALADQEEFPKALESFKQSAEIWRTHLGERHPNVAKANFSISLAHVGLKEPVKAIAPWRKAAEIWRDRGEGDALATCLNFLGEALDAAGEPTEARASAAALPRGVDAPEQHRDRLR